jgi:hypothetical protein
MALRSWRRWPSFSVKLSRSLATFDRLCTVSPMLVAAKPMAVAIAETIVAALPHVLPAGKLNHRRIALLSANPPAALPSIVSCANPNVELAGGSCWRRPLTLMSFVKHREHDWNVLHAHQREVN